ncbi:MAG TPA: 3-oxoadipyl-CoA thiolase [Bryobacteraceae bacterium]|nr:3-oxoadipyl-CoA thiolase [Bryobacteraceae bacterium]
MEPVYFCDAIRTPFGRYGGGLAAVRVDDLAAIPIRALMERNPQADWLRLDDVFYGCANQSGEDNRNVARMAALLAGLNERIPATTVNRLCGSSLDAAALAARSILSGEISFAIAGGVESMSRAPFVMGKPDAPFARGLKLEDTTMGWRFINPLMKQMYGTDTMPETAENVAAEYGIARKDQDLFALRSQQKAASAIADGRMAEEIIAAGSLTTDEHPRPQTTIEALAKLKPVVRPEGTVTAGNASGINDGACALLVASESGAREHGLQPKARFVASASVGVAPRIMGMGPVPATERVLAKAGLKLDQIDIIELNEAFAAQGLAVLRQLRLADDDPRVNPRGGAIALGHPLGASGARLLTTAICQLQRTGGRYALCTMCIGVGQGIAMVIERV